MRFTVFSRKTVIAGRRAAWVHETKKPHAKISVISGRRCRSQYSVGKLKHRTARTLGIFRETLSLAVQCRQMKQGTARQSFDFFRGVL